MQKSCSNLAKFQTLTHIAEISWICVNYSDCKIVISWRDWCMEDQTWPKKVGVDSSYPCEHMDGFGVIVLEDSWTKISVFLFNSSTAEVETNLEEVGLEAEAPPLLGRGLWSHKKKSLQTSVFSLKCESVQLTDTVCWTSDLCEYCCAQCCTIRSTAVSILVLLQYVQSCSMLMFLSVWPPGGAATVCMPSRSFQVNGLFAAEVGWLQRVKRKARVVLASGLFPLRSLGKRLCAALWKYLQSTINFTFLRLVQVSFQVLASFWCCNGSIVSGIPHSKTNLDKRHKGRIYALSKVFSDNIFQFL